MSTPQLSPLNDFVATVTLMDVGADGVETPIAAGTVTAFFATSHTSDATAADAALTTSASYTGAGGVWLIRFDAATLTKTLLDSLFVTATPYLIVQLTGAVRVWKKCQYIESRAAT